MRKILTLAILIAMLGALVVPMSADGGTDKACFGLVAAAYGQLGLQGEHASSFAPDPRIGLANLAQLLFDMGVLDEPTMWALGEYLNEAENLNIEACL